jgi:L-ascorbate metabolism protein UlaG (beta-lactamase superfamily)
MSLQEKRVDITWYGQACFRIREMGVTIITDPFGRDSEYALPRIRADVITQSNVSDLNDRPKGIRGSPRIFRTPGEYEVGGVFVTGLPVFSQTEQGWQKDVVFVYGFERLTVCHLGRSGYLLTRSQVEALKGVDLLLVPIDGQVFRSFAEQDVLTLFEPSIVIPMHYDLTRIAHDRVSLSRFLKTMGADDITSHEVFKIRAGNLPDDLQIVLLKCT